MSARASTLVIQREKRLVNENRLVHGHLGRGEGGRGKGKGPRLGTYVGGGNSIFRSIRPGRSKAGSRMSSLFVAMMTLIFFVGSNPSS